MPSTTHKRVLVLPTQGAWVPGFLDGSLDLNCLSNHATLPLVTVQGQASTLRPDDVLAIFFVSGFERLPELGASGPAARRSQRRPGLWVRARLQDQRALEGIVASDLLHLDAGLTLTPVYAECVWQRLWIPRIALVSLTPLEMVKPPRHRRGLQPDGAHREQRQRQIPLFESEPGPSSLEERS